MGLGGRITRHLCRTMLPLVQAPPLIRSIPVAPRIQSNPSRFVCACDCLATHPTHLLPPVVVKKEEDGGLEGGGEGGRDRSKLISINRATGMGIKPGEGRGKEKEKEKEKGGRRE